MWNDGKTTPYDRPVLVRSGACVSVAAFDDDWAGWVAHADGFDARDQHGEIIVIAHVDYWCEIPDLILKG